MSDIERYITDEAVSALASVVLGGGSLEAAFRVGLAHAYFSIRADVLREASERTVREGQKREREGHRDSAAECNRCAVWLLRLADEAVTE